MKLRTLVIVAASLAVATSVGYYIRNASLVTPEDDPLIGTKVFDQDILIGPRQSRLIQFL